MATCPSNRIGYHWSPNIPGLVKMIILDEPTNKNISFFFCKLLPQQIGMKLLKESFFHRSSS
jgi:hypothetical protein